eukprot:3032295-Rhodomonas_salina.1
MSGESIRSTTRKTDARAGPGSGCQGCSSRRPLPRLLTSTSTHARQHHRSNQWREPCEQSEQMGRRPAARSSEWMAWTRSSYLSSRSISNLSCAETRIKKEEGEKRHAPRQGMQRRGVVSDGSADCRTLHSHGFKQNLEDRVLLVRQNLKDRVLTRSGPLKVMGS